MEESGAKRRRVCKSEHDIFLSHSGKEKAFVEQLYHDLRRMNQRPFFDQDLDCLHTAENFPLAIFEAAKQCRVGVVVVSKGYLTSKWPMLELSKFVECGVQVFPLFFKLSPIDLKKKEVETKWKLGWRKLVEKGEVGEEVVELWSKAVKVLRANNGLEFKRFAKSEYKYRCAVVEEICKRWPPILKWSMDGIQGYERLCEAMLSMFMEANFRGKDQIVEKYLGIYGMGGLGKTTLCKSMCGYFLGEFGGRVLHLELPSDPKGGEEGLARLKRVLQKLAGVEKSVLASIFTEEEGWACLEYRLPNMLPVFLAIDNVGDFAASREEAKRYVNIGLPSGSKVLVTARSQEILKGVLGDEECLQPIPRLVWMEAATLLLSYAAPNISSVSCLNADERDVVEKCLSHCRFNDSGYESRQHHPLVLRALGTYLYDGCRNDVMSWGEALVSWKVMRGCEEAASVNDILGLNYHSLPDQVKLVFLDSVFYHYEITINNFRGWWFEEDQNHFEKWVSWISEVHGVSPIEGKNMAKKLQRLSLVEDSDSRVSIHDLYKEFARALVEKEGSKEWQWWMSRASDQTQLKRLVMDTNKADIGVAPRRFLEMGSLVVLELYHCDVGPDLELGSFHSLRTLGLFYCLNVKRITCSCNRDYNDGVRCYERSPGRGCMAELLSVCLFGLDSLEGIPFMRHCWNLRHFKLHVYAEAPRFADSKCDLTIDFRYLQALESFYMYSCIEHGSGAFMRSFFCALHLRKLIAFAFKSGDEMESVDSYKLDLNEVVGLSPRLCYLGVALPRKMEELKGLHLLSELTLLDLFGSRGLRRLPDLRCLPKLKWLCVHECCGLEGSVSVAPGVKGICESDGYDEIAMFHGHDLHEDECLNPYCGSRSCEILPNMCEVKASERGCEDKCDSEDDSEVNDREDGR